MFYNKKTSNTMQLNQTKDEEIKNNISKQKKIAIKDQDFEKINLIQRLESEIEKLFVIKKIREDAKLLKVFQDDVDKVVKDSHFHLIEMILMKEIELLMLGDLDAIGMLEGLKKSAQKKIDNLNKLAIEIHQNSIKTLKNDLPNFIIPKYATQTFNSYKPLTNYDGFHLERTMGGDYIQVLDADLKNLVGQDILNSKPENLSNEILQEIKDFRRGAIAIQTDNSSPDQTQNSGNQITEGQEQIDAQSKVFKNKIQTQNSKKWQKDIKQEEERKKDINIEKNH